MEEKVFFLAGDLVTVKQDLDYKPVMYVVGKVTSHLRPKNESRSDFFKGIKCRWFSKNLELQESIFNTKDLIKIK